MERRTYGRARSEDIETKHNRVNVHSVWHHALLTSWITTRIRQ